MYIDVLVELKAKQVDKTFTYFVKPEQREKIQVGIRVLVPFSYQKLEGFVLNIHHTKPDYEVKEILHVIDEEPILNEEMLELGHYISKKTFSTLISAYQTMLPKALKAKHDFVVPKKYVTYLFLKKENCILKGKQKEIYELVQEQGKLLKKEANQISSSATKALIEKGILEEKKEEIYRIHDGTIKEEKKIVLNEEQKKVVTTVLENGNHFVPYLLHGVTGSGKTEVYMHIMEEILKTEKEAIVLVPEISLTPQMVHHFKKRFGSEVAILHSGLNEGEKYDEWRKIKRKEVKIAIGARSAIFAPFTNLGIIIIDEEHSTSYKQENMPRYSAIDVALYRAKTYHCPVIMGSATPSIESYTRAKTGIYQLLELKNRVNHQLPEVQIIDMKKEMRERRNILSQRLQDEIQKRLEKKEQVLLLLNRRGYSTIVTCKCCGYVDKCPNCDIPLTYHKDSNTMRCHYCGYGSSKLTICPKCRSKEINEYGLGTQKLEEMIKKQYQNAKVIRMDMDTTSKKGSHEKITHAFENGEYDILLGTQMIAKGLDFPNVTLVGVLNGDATLEIPDFRSSERTFQLLNQVAGRSGRSEKKGEVFIQCFNTNHYSIVTASHHDYNRFYQEEMNIRKKLNYPPFYNLALIRIQGKNLEEVMAEANKVGIHIKTHLKNCATVLGPSPAQMPKVNQVYFYQIILKYKKNEDIYQELKFIKEKYQNNNKVYVDIELNPIRV